MRKGEGGERKGEKVSVGNLNAASLKDYLTHLDHGKLSNALMLVQLKRKVKQNVMQESDNVALFTEKPARINSTSV